MSERQPVQATTPWWRRLGYWFWGATPPQRAAAEAQIAAQKATPERIPNAGPAAVSITCQSNVGVRDTGRLCATRRD